MSATDTVSSKSATTVDFQPYLFFYGRCEEALNFYKEVFGGTYEVQRNSDAPQDMQQHLPSGQGDRIMHGRFTAPGLTFMAADGRVSKTIDADEGNISLAISYGDEPTGRRVFDGLAQGGKVTMPLQEAFWGGKFGIVQDRFGIEWMITTP
ncbi:MAG: VOC family protein [Candidatus Eremiobacteraeota bacterium]|nr:VOC family protein [Candidatus Eremiobacteraeota bacterium]